jgi:ADP-ribose pyrophosphatase
MNDIWPKILRTTRRRESPWIEFITRDVQFSAQGAIEAYDAIGQQDYCVALAVTPDSRILLVRQFRPALERFSLEFPAGMIDPGESADSAVARELLEETGYPAETIDPIGKTATCAGRISNSMHSFFVRTGDRVVGFSEEQGVSVSLATADQLRGLILAGEFSEQCHLGVIALANARSLITF